MLLFKVNGKGLPGYITGGYALRKSQFPVAGKLEAQEIKVSTGKPLPWETYIYEPSKIIPNGPGKPLLRIPQEYVAALYRAAAIDFTVHDQSQDSEFYTLRDNVTVEEIPSREFAHYLPIDFGLKN